MEAQGEGTQGQGEGGPPAPGWYPDANGQTRWWDGSQWGQLAAGAAPVPTGYSAPQATSGTDPRTMAMLAHLLGIFTGFIGPLVIYLVNGDKDPFVRHHAAESLNFQISLMIAYVISFVLMFVLIGFLLFPVIWIGSLVFMIMGAVNANKGEWWKYPINLRMVSGGVG